jgi:hypothetical protein
MNAVAHAVEALYAQAANPVTSLLAQQGIAMLTRAAPHHAESTGELFRWAEVLKRLRQPSASSAPRLCTAAAHRLLYNRPIAGPVPPQEADELPTAFTEFRHARQAFNP